jgi:hypothetical protein
VPLENPKGEARSVSEDSRTDAGVADSAPGTGDRAEGPPSEPEPVAPVRGRLGRRPLLIFAGGGIALYALFSAGVPKDQRLRLLLGSRAKTASRVTLTWSATSGEVLREATYSFPPGTAPEALIQELRLADGDYDLDVEIVTREGRTAERKRVTVRGATTTLDMSGRP